MKPAIVRIIVPRNGNGSSFLGTGIVVTPNHVLTCKHVVRERDPAGRMSDHQHSYLAVETDTGTQVAAHHVVDDDLQDLSLLFLEHSVKSSPARILTRLARSTEPALVDHRKQVLGFAEADFGQSLRLHDVTKQIILTTFFDKDDEEFLSELQLSGGLPSGCSGGALTVDFAGTPLLAGIVYLGGERSATSRVIMADRITAFMKRCSVRIPSTVNAINVFAAAGARSQDLQAVLNGDALSLQARNPYRGLSAFRPIDAPFFFGRNDEVATLTDTVRSHPFVALVGASGSGKSSLLHAGLVPALTDKADVHAVVFRPRGAPGGFGELAAALVGLVSPEADLHQRAKKQRDIAQDLADGALSPMAFAQTWCASQPHRKLVLVIDQFEEIFTQHAPAEMTKFFINAIVGELASDAPLGVVVSMRADFVGRALEPGPLADRFVAYPTLFLTQMTPDQKRAAIERPAQRMGVGLEAGLCDRLIEDLGDEPGVLPLLEFALMQLWEQQSHGQITHAAYENIGGVRKALAKYADSVVKELDGKDTELREIFVQLIRPGDGTEDTRQVATRPQIGAENWPIVQALADRRLVVTAIDEDRETETAELVHEALIRAWPCLQEWIARDRAFRTWQNRLRVGLRDWQDGGVDDDLLLRGAGLAQAEEMLAENDAQIPDAERAYIEMSAELRDRTALQQRRRSKIIAGALAAGFVVFAALAGLAYNQAQIARGQFQTAVSQTLATQAGQLIAARPNDLESFDQAAAFAVESWRRRRNPDAVNAALDLLIRMPDRRITFPDRIANMAVSPDGRMAVVTLDDGSLRFIDVTKTQVTHQVMLEKYASTLIFSPDGEKLLAIPHNSRTGVLLHRDGSEVARVPFGKSGTMDPAFSPDSRYLGFGSEGGATVLDADRGTKVFDMPIEAARPIQKVRFSADSRYFYASAWHSGDHTSRHIASLAAQAEILTIDDGPKAWVHRVDFHEPKDWIAVAIESEVRVLSLETKEVLARLPFDGSTRNVAFSPDGRYLGAGSLDGTARIYESETWKELGRLTDKKGFWRVVFSPDNRFFFAQGRTGEFETVCAHVLNLATMQETARAVHGPEYCTEEAFSPDARFVATSGADGTAILVGTQNGELRARVGPYGARVDWVRFSSDSQYLLSFGIGSVYSQSKVVVTETATGLPIAYVPGYSWTEAAFTADSARVLSTHDRVFRIHENALSGKDWRIGRIDPGKSPTWEFFDDRTILVSAADAFHVINIETGETRFSVPAQEKQLPARISSDHKHFLSDRTGAHLVSLETGEVLVKDIRIPDQASNAAMPEWLGPFMNFDATEDNKIAYFASMNPMVGTFLFDKDTGRLERHLPQMGFLQEVDAQRGKLLVNEHGARSIVDIETQERQYPIDTGQDLWRKFDPTRSFSLDGKRNTGTLNMRRAATNELIARIEHGNAHAFGSFSPDGRFLATASEDGYTRLVETETGNVLRSDDQHGYIERVLFSDNSRYLMVLSGTKVSLIDIGAAEVVREFAQYGAKQSAATEYHWAFSADSQYFGISHDQSGGAPRLIATRDGSDVVTLVEGRVLGGSLDKPRGFQFSADGRYAAIGYEEGFIDMVSLQDGETMYRIRTSNDSYITYAFSNTADYLLISDRSVRSHRLIETATGTELASYNARSAGFSPDGSRVVILGDIGLRALPVDPDEIIERLCEKSGTNLSADVWKDYFGTAEAWRPTCAGWENAGDVSTVSQ